MATTDLPVPGPPFIADFVTQLSFGSYFLILIFYHFSGHFTTTF